MVKPILHFQIPMMPNATRENQIAVSPELFGKFMKVMKDNLNDEYDVVATPMKLKSCDDTNVEVKNIEFTMEDIERILKIIEQKSAKSSA